MDPEDAVMAFLRYLRHRGLHVTTARERVARAACVTDGHFDAGDLWARLRSDQTSTAPATVYRTLNLMVDAGVLRRLDFDEGAQYEVAMGRPRHEHLVCERCGRILEFRDPELDARLAEAGHDLEFQPHRHQLIIWGRCAACQRNGQP